MEIKKQTAEEIYESTPIKDTPFQVIHYKEQNLCFGVFGQYRITKNFEDPKQVIEELTNMTWDKIITVMSLVYEMLKNQSEQSKTEVK